MLGSPNPAVPTRNRYADGSTTRASRDIPRCFWSWNVSATRAKGIGNDTLNARIALSRSEDVTGEVIDLLRDAWTRNL